MEDKTILDVCCGSRMFWFDRQEKHTVFMDNRVLHETLCDGRKLDIEPDVVGDFRDIPFPDGSFHLVVFDPPHLVSAGPKSWMAKKYGKLQRASRFSYVQFDESIKSSKRCYIAARG